MTLFAGDPRKDGVTLTNEPAAVGEIMKSFLPMIQRSPAQSRTPVPPAPTNALQLYVAPQGSDANPGTRREPFATLERARDEIRALKQRKALPSGGAHVVIGGGRYRIRDTFRLEARDSGTEAAPVIYRAAAGEQPVFQGSVYLNKFSGVTDEKIRDLLPEAVRDKVRQVDLADHGITNLPPLILGGFSSGRGFKSHPVPQLYYEGRLQPMARSPGWLTIAEVSNSDPVKIHGLVGSKTGRFSYMGDRPSRWAAEPELWIYGYYFWSWADSYEKVAKIDPTQKEITLAPPYHTYGYRKGQKFYAINAISELDEPGEWVLHASANRIYWLPPNSPTIGLSTLNSQPSTSFGTVALAVAKFPMMELKDVSHVRFEHLVWEGGAGDGIIVSGGTNCLLAGVTLRRFSGNAVSISGGHGNGLLSCDIHTLGRGGVILQAGDRKTLARGEAFIENCHIYDLSNIDHTYTPAVLVSGVGNRIAHNWFHDIPSSAIRLGGNDHVVEFNEVNRVVLESDDQGGVDMWGDPTIQGILFRYNFFHHIGDWRNPDQAPELGKAGIRLDDAISGVMIYGNIFYRAASGKRGFGAVQIHGGKDNVIDNNIFADCRWAVSFSPWAEARWTEFIKSHLTSPDIDIALYRKKYPPMRRFDAEINVNWFLHNLVVNCGVFLRDNASAAMLYSNLVVTNHPTLAPLASGDFRSMTTTPDLERIAFKPIPFAGIGLYTDPFRRELPAKEIERLRQEK